MRTFLLASLLVLTASSWPRWRGPLDTGVSTTATPPVTWSPTEHVAWKTPIPGRGLSTPVATAGKLFLTTAVPIGPTLEPTAARGPQGHDNLPVTKRQQYTVLAVDADTGAVLWKTVVHEGEPHAQGHHTGSLASASPATDGARVYASFGSNGLYALDLDGTVVWKQQLGTMATKHAHGEGASPALGYGRLVVTWDHEGESFVAAYDAATGKELWWEPRDEPTSWATPVLTEHDGKPIAIVPGTGALRAYDLATGAVLWEVAGLSHNIVASPVVGDGMVFAGSSYEHQALLAVKLDGTLVWSRSKDTPYVPSPLLHDGTLYYLAHYQRKLTAVDAATGRDRRPPMALPAVRSLYASPVAADGRLYLTDLEGVTVVLDAATGEVLATNTLGESVSASAVPLGRRLYLRGDRHLFALESPTGG